MKQSTKLNEIRIAMHELKVKLVKYQYYELAANVRQMELLVIAELQNLK